MRASRAVRATEPTAAPLSLVPAVLVACVVCIPVAAPPAAAQEAAAAEGLDASPRHHEWADVPAGEGRTVRTFVAYPEAEGDVPAVVVIHENRGLTDWVRSFADELAGAGYLAVAPDLLSGFDAEHPHTGAFESSDAARQAIYELDADRVTADLRAVREYAADLPGSNGTTAVAGFCWGGSQTFRFSTQSQEVAAAFVFYGTAPDDPERIAAIEAPVYGFYGQTDQRVNATISRTQQAMTAFGKTYDPVIYDGVGHAFMRRASAPDAPPEATKARDEAFERLTDLLAGLE
ncbi:MAG: dienelactone hydrolase family protein [Thermoanaerobaculia bacterium]